MTPFRIDIRTECVASMETLSAQAQINANYPRVEESPRHGRKLAVVGGGPQVAKDLDELRAWDGDIWAINYTAQWLSEHGVKATLFSIDPLPMQVEAADALLATCCHPDIVKHYQGRVRVFDLCETHPDGITGGIVTAARAPSLSFLMGYLDVSFFGCEGSFEFEQSEDGSFKIRDHVDRHEAPSAMLVVRAGGQDYCTSPGFLVQCQQLSALFCAFPDVYHNRSHGLVRAMVENPDTWEVVAVSHGLKVHLEEVNGKQGLYDSPYKQAA